MTTETEVVEKQDAKVEQQEAEAGFAKGFQKVAGKPTAEKDTTTAETSDAKDEADAAAKAKDEADAKAKAEAEAKVSADAKAAADHQKFLEGLPRRLSTLEGSLGGLKSQLTTALATAKAATTEGKVAPSQAQIADAATSGERWKKLEEDFPEFAAAFQEQMAASQKEVLGKMPKPLNLDDIKKDVVGAVQPMLQEVKSEARQLARVDLKHEGWEETIKTQAFGDWMKVQAPEVQALADSDKATDAIKLLDSFEVHRKKVADDAAAKLKKEKRLAGAITPQGTAGVAETGISDEAAFERGFKRVVRAKK